MKQGSITVNSAKIDLRQSPACQEPPTTHRVGLALEERSEGISKEGARPHSTAHKERRENRALKKTKAK